MKNPLENFAVKLRKNNIKACSVSILIAAALGATSTINAQSNDDDDIEEITIKAHPLHEQGLSQNISILSGEELTDAIESNLGDTLAKQVGVRSASFGIAAGRPIIRGLGGPRVKTTEDTIDSLDVSVTSTDHAVTVEPFIAEQIVILKGASTLLYGPGAIGGVVDTETGRIPTKLNEEDFSGRGEFRVSDNEDGTAGAIRLDGNLSDNFAWHVDAFTKEADDYEIPGFAESAAFIAAEEAEEGGEEEEEEEEVFGVLEGSRFDIQGYAGGISWVDGENHLGLSISGTDGTYGLVGGHHEEGEEEEEEEEGEEEPGRIDLEQTRIDFSGRFTSSLDIIESFEFRVGINDYEHSEIEGNGEIGTLFDNDAWEARFLANHTEVMGFTGTVGLQISDRDFSAVGEEAFVPPSETDTVGLFWVGERQFENFSLELGSRIDSFDTDSENSVSRSFTTFSTSAGAVVPLSQTTTLTALVDYAERAPGIEELFSNGPHLATQTFEIGDPNLNEESSINFTFSLAYETELLDAHASFYHYDFDDYIFQSATGEIDDDLPVLVYQQNDAEFTGLELEVGVHLLDVASGDLDLRFSYDLVDADVDGSGNGNLPRIPADRFTVGLVWGNEVWRAKLSYADTASQRDNAPFELPTEGYEDISAKIERKFAIGDGVLTAFIHGKNLSDEEQRNSTSFVKDLAPAPGRRIEAGVQFDF